MNDRETLELAVRLYRPACEISERERLPQALASSVERFKGSVELFGMTGWTNSALLAEAGIPSVVFGPGGSGLHGLQEYGNTLQIGRCREILVDVAKTLFT